MTKYILHGGFTKQGCNNKKEFFSEITTNLPDKSNILLVYFHCTEEQLKRCFNENKKNFVDYSNGKNFQLVVATEKNFISQLKKADVVFIRGGDTIKLLEILKKQPKFIFEIKNKKIVVGISAGVYVLSKYFYANNVDEVFKGFGVLPIRARCHYSGELKKIEKKFAKYPQSQKYELILFSECEYIVKYVK